MMTAYYNENDKYCAAWLRNLIAAGHIAPGDVDERSIVDVRPDDVRAYRQCHWFAGIAGWSYALRLAGWDDSRFVWTGSCPCTPFSTAGKGAGGKDSRHLWPHWFRLIRECRPAILFGENVEAAIGWGWLDAVLGDLEAEGYATGAAVLGAHSVGAPHKRARLWFVAKSERSRCEGKDLHLPEWRPRQAVPGADGASPAGELADARYRARGKLGEFSRSTSADERTSSREGRDGIERRAAHSSADGGVGELADARCGGGKHQRHDMTAAPSSDEGETRQQRLWSDARAGESTGELAESESFQHDRSGDARRGRGELANSGLMGDADASGLSTGECQEFPGAQQFEQGRATEQPSCSPWADLVWLPCADGKARPTQPGLFPLAFRIPGRVGKLRAYGNAIVPQVAAEFIKCFRG